MYKLPDDLDLSYLANAQLIQVCFGENDLVLHFHPQATLLVTSRVEIDPDGVSSEPPFSVLADHLLSFLGACISSVTPRGDSDLMFAFGDRTIIVVDDSPHYESYVLTLPDREIIV